jgi:predicted aconitase
MKLTVTKLNSTLIKGATMQITVKVKNVYGAEKIYPICEQAQIFAAMTGCKTLTDVTISYIKKLGYKVLLDEQPKEI